MCMICLEFQKKRMTIFEARTALKELILFGQSESELAHLKEMAQLSDEEFAKKAQEAVAPLQP